MQHRITHAAPSLVVASVATLAPCLVLLAGCSGGGSRVNEDRILQRAGLSANERQPGRPAAEQPSDSAALAPRPVGSVDPIASVQVLVGPPESRRASNPPEQPGQALPPRGEEPAPPPAPVQRTTATGSGFVDAVVGQINGRPVYASEFFAPMDARLRADAARLPPNQWMNQAASTIRSALRDRMVQELLLAEFQASLTREQRQGLLSFVGSLRQRLVAENLGSESLASSRLEESEGLTLEQKIQQQRDTEIIRAQINRAIGDRIYVSWREVELEYERNYDDYNPAPVARLRMLQVSERNPERVQEARDALANGEAFEAVATRLSDFRATEGGLWTITVEREGYENTRIFAPDELNEVAIRLSPGEVSDEFRWSGSAVWLTLEAIESPASRSLYDAQLEIHERLRRQRIAEEEAEYVVRLLGRASVTDLGEMLTRLLEIAQQRYLRQPSPGPGS